MRPSEPYANLGWVGEGVGVVNRRDRRNRAESEKQNLNHKGHEVTRRKRSGDRALRSGEPEKIRDDPC